MYSIIICMYVCIYMYVCMYVHTHNYINIFAYSRFLLGFGHLPLRRRGLHESGCGLCRSGRSFAGQQVSRENGPVHVQRLGQESGEREVSLGG